MRRSYDSWTPEQEEALRHARQEGLTAGEIAKLLNRTTASIQCKTQGGEYPLGKRATQKKGAFPELHAPYTVEQIGGYSPVDTSDDETFARRQVGF